MRCINYRIVAFTVNHILVRMYHQGIHINEQEFLQVKTAAEEAKRRKISLIFLPNHKSHVDYLVIRYKLLFLRM